MRRMEKVTGRSDDMIILRGVNVFPTQIEEALLATDWCGGHFVSALRRAGRTDGMAVPAEARAGCVGGVALSEHAGQGWMLSNYTIRLFSRRRHRARS